MNVLRVHAPVIRFLMSSALLLPLLSACAASPAAPDGRDSQSGVLADIRGEARIRRTGWTSEAPALPGAEFGKGDLLYLEPDGKAALVCPSLDLALLEDPINPYGCRTAAAPALAYAAGLAIPTRSDAGAGYPVSLAPRGAKLLNPRPTLRWSEVPGATAYRVEVRGTSWSTLVTGVTELVYPADAPPLEPGKTYRLVVEAGGRSSDEEPGAGLGFSLLDSDEARQVYAGQQEIRSWQLSDQATRLLVARLFAAHGLLAEAQDMIWPIRSTLPAAGRLLGDLYLDTGLSRHAEEAYLEALSAAEAAGDLEGQALSLAALGSVYLRLGNREQAAARFDAAARLYEALGDDDRAIELRGRIAERP